MKPYTVLLLRPDYIAESTVDTYTTHVTAEDEAQAMKFAQKEAARIDSGYAPYDDYACIGLFEGLHTNKAPLP